MAHLKELFDGLGWLANAIGILLFVSAAIAFANRCLRGRGRDHNFNHHHTAELDAHWVPASAKEFAQTAIVDDKPTDFPITELRSAEYNVETIKTVSLSELDGLAIKDIVFLDIKGIVKDDPEKGGLRVIERLRGQNKFQKICAVSSQTFDPTATAFFRQADDQKTKPLTAMECQQTIDTFIDEIFRLEPLFDRSNQIARTMTAADRRQLMESFDDFAKERKTDAEFLAALRKTPVSLEAMHTIYCLSRIVRHETRRLRTH